MLQLVWSAPACVFLLGLASSLCVLGLAFGVPAVLKAPLFRHAPADTVVLLAIAGTWALGWIGPRLALFTERFSPASSQSGVACCALLTGLAAALAPRFLTVVESMNAWAHSRFMLSDLLIYGVQLVLAFMACLVPCATLAFVAQCVTMEFRKSGAFDRITTLLLVAGTSVGFIAAIQLRTVPATILLIGSLPMLLLAVIAGDYANLQRKGPKPAAA